MKTILLLRRTLCLIVLVCCPGGACAQRLTFADVLRQAVDHSYELKIGKLEVEIGQQRVNEVGAMYWPTVSLRCANEYLYDLSRDGSGTVAVGDTLISGNESTFQDSVTLSAGYLLYDFGARSLTFQNAERDVSVARFLVAQGLVDLRDRVLSVYGRGLVLQEKLAVWRLLVNQRNEVYRLTARLEKAGTVGKVELGAAGIAVAEAVQLVTSYEVELEEVAQDLIFLTGTTYEAPELEFSDLRPAVHSGKPVDVHNLPEIKAYAVAIEKKKSEYQIAKRAWLPRLNLYSSYRLYGSDPANAVESFTGMQERNATVGVVLDMNLFNGFGDLAKAERLQTEQRKLEVEREKKLAEKRKLMNAITEKAGIYERYDKDWQAFHGVLEAQGTMTERLAGQQILDRIGYLRHQGEQLETGLDLHLKRVERDLNAMQLNLLALGASS